MNQITINLFNQRNEQAFRQIFEHLLQDMMNFSCSITNDFHESEDIVIHSFHKLWNINKKFDTPKDLRNFTVAIVRNASLNYVKIRKRNAKAIIYSSDSAYTYEEYKKEFYECIEKLPTGYKMMCIMAALGFTNMQIAHKTNKSLRAVEVQKFRAIKALRKLARKT